MQLEDYFDFMGPDVIRLKGHRIGLEHIVERFNDGASPESIMVYFGTLTLEEVYAAITYYLHNKAEVDAYLERLDRFAEEQERLADANPPPVVVRLRALAEQREREALERKRSKPRYEMEMQEPTPR